MKKLLIVLFLNCSLLASYIDERIIEYSKKLDKLFNVDNKIILAYILTESRALPYSILVKTQKAKLLSEILNEYGLKNKKTNNYVSIFPNTKTQAEFLYDFIKQYEKPLKIVDYDLGIMQINKRTIKRFNLTEKRVYLNLFLNMEVGTKVMRTCYDLLKNKTNINNILECYNRGASIKWLNQSKRTYLKNFLKNYKKIEKGEY